MNGVRLSERFFRWHPDNWPGLTPDELLHFAVDVFNRVALYDAWIKVKNRNCVLLLYPFLLPVKYSPNSCSIFKARSWVFFACSSLMRRFISLLKKRKVSIKLNDWFQALHYRFNRFWLDEYCDRVQLSHLEPFDCVPRNVQNAVFSLLLNQIYYFSDFNVKVKSHLLGNLSHARYWGSIKIVVILSSFDEQMILDITFHLLTWWNKVVVTSVDFVFTLGSSGIYLTIYENFGNDANTADTYVEHSFRIYRDIPILGRR